MSSFGERMKRENLMIIFVIIIFLMATLFLATNLFLHSQTQVNFYEHSWVLEVGQYPSIKFEEVIFDGEFNVTTFGDSSFRVYLEFYRFIEGSTNHENTTSLLLGFLCTSGEVNNVSGQLSCDYLRLDFVLLPLVKVDDTFEHRFYLFFSGIS